MLGAQPHPERREPFGGGIHGEVRAADLVAEVDQHFGDARHTCAADADEMDPPDLVLHLASSMQRAATRRAASGLPSTRACFAISSSFGRSSERISATCRPAARSRCASEIAAPRSASNLPLADAWPDAAWGRGSGMAAMRPARA